nr:unnamed protein product [Callosobruchus chinensis]
MLLYQK